MITLEVEDGNETFLGFRPNFQTLLGATRNALLLVGNLAHYGSKDWVRALNREEWPGEG
ncbi:hypothetical protein LEP1GSC187_1264 [Leptospira santarosai str. ZUN179]|uniref:Uncharacterized protein n=1 Tax=Leptospira santarosai str. ZUN179 TaxID=1049985 RepID=M6UKR8_9LEPT|nr:hypothetical protein LEP1GSC187_1264 [Leptospira santarosai str. ZUN179]